MHQRRMFGSRNVPKVAKYAVVIYMYTVEAKRDSYSDTAQMKARRTTRKMLIKLYERLLKDTHYNKNSRHGRDGNFTDWMNNVIRDGRRPEYFRMWMLEVNQCVHDIVHQLAQDYDPNDTESKKCDFYQEIFEELTV